MTLIHGGVADLAARARPDRSFDGRGAFTYRELFDRIEAEKTSAGVKAGTVANIKSTLISWAEHRGETLDTVVGDSFAGPDFGERRDAFLARCVAEGARPTTVTSIRSRFNTLRTTALAMVVTESETDDGGDSFAHELRTAIAASGQPRLEIVKRALKQVGVTKPELIHAWHTTMKSWMNRKSLPTTQVTPRLQALEKVLGLSKGTLTKYARPRGRYAWKWQQPRAEVPATHADLSKPHKQYGLQQAQWPAAIRATYDDIVAFKTAEDPYPLVRTAPSHSRSRGKDNRWSRNGRDEVPAARIHRDIAIHFFGYLTQPKDAEDVQVRGRGLMVSAITYAMMGDAALVKGFLALKSVRSGGHTAYARQVFGAARTLVAPTTGYIWQLPDQFIGQLAYLGANAPKTAEAVRSWCEAQTEELTRYEKLIETNYVSPRDPKRALADLLSADAPLDVIFEAIDLLEQHRPGRYSSQRFQAQHEAAIFTLVAFASIPLRVTTWCLMRVEHIKKHRDGTLWVHVPKQLFKNREYLKEDYNVPVPAWAQPYWERYLNQCRDQLPGARAGSPYVLVNIHGVKKNGGGPVRAKSMYMRMQQYTFSTIGRALGCHWVRHLAATDFLKNNPGNYPAAAAILHDKLETVIKEYGHLGTADYFKIFGDYTSRRFSAAVRRLPEAA